MKKFIKFIIFSFLLIGSSSCSRDINKYVTVTFLNYNDNVLYNVVVDYGESAIYKGPQPIRPSEEIDNYLITYKFLGWDKSTKSVTTKTDVHAIYSVNRTIIDENKIPVTNHDTSEPNGEFDVNEETNESGENIISGSSSDYRYENEIYKLKTIAKETGNYNDGYYQRIFYVEVLSESIYSSILEVDTRNDTLNFYAFQYKSDYSRSNNVILSFSNNKSNTAHLSYVYNYNNGFSSDRGTTEIYLSSYDGYEYITFEAYKGVMDKYVAEYTARNLLNTYLKSIKRYLSIDIGALGFKSFNM